MQQKKLPEQIETKRTFIKKYETNMAEETFDILIKNRERIPYIVDSDRPIKSVNGEIKRIESLINNFDNMEEFYYAIFDKENRKYIGEFETQNISWENNRVEAGYWIDKDFEGKGYVSEAMIKMEEVLFDAGFNRIELTIHSDNVKSIRVAEKRGYKKDGILRSYKFINGEYKDIVIYSKLKKDIV